MSFSENEGVLWVVSSLDEETGCTVLAAVAQAKPGKNTVAQRSALVHASLAWLGLAWLGLACHSYVH